jgi:hypothetical protein
MAQEDNYDGTGTSKLSLSSTTDWDRAKLIEIGIKEEFVLQLDDTQASEFLKGALYLCEKNKEYSEPVNDDI